MSPGLFSSKQRAAIDAFPKVLSDEARDRCFVLSEADRGFVGRFGDGAVDVALMLGSLRMLGFVPSELPKSTELVAFVAGQLMQTEEIDVAGAETPERSRRHRVAATVSHAGWRRPDKSDLKLLDDWLLERAMEHDRPEVLFGLTLDWLRVERLVRPGITVIERAVAKARERAWDETYDQLSLGLSDEQISGLGRLLEIREGTDVSTLAWLRTPPTGSVAVSVAGAVERLAVLRSEGSFEVDLSGLSPNRVRHLARLGRRSTAQAIGRMQPARRHQVILATLADLVITTTDTLIDLLVIGLAESESRARQSLVKKTTATAAASVDKVRLFSQIAAIILDPEVADDQVRQRVHQLVSPVALSKAAGEAEEILEPMTGGHLGVWESRYGSVRQFAPKVLAAITFEANPSDDRLLSAVEFLQQINQTRRRSLGEDTPIAFVPPRWKPLVFNDDGSLDRHFWELCVLAELRTSLQSGAIWVSPSRKYADPATYLLPTERWSQLRFETIAMAGVDSDAACQLADMDARLDRQTRALDDVLAANADTGIRLDSDGHLIVPPLKAETVDDTVMGHHDITSRIPQVDLAEVLADLDQVVGLTDLFTHAAGQSNRIPDFRVHLFAAILAHGCNLGVNRMARISGLSAEQLRWISTWYLRHETLTAANDAIINFHHAQPVAGLWGDGTLSSSDGQRFAVGVQTPVARYQRRYFVDKGATIYSWTSDQHVQYGSKVIPATAREATYVLDGILDNHNDLRIEEHTTDTAGYTDLVFGLFELLGLRFSPRVRDIADHRLWRIGPLDQHKHAGPLVKSQIRTQRIIDHWDDMLRVAGSLRHGWTPASVLVAKLQSGAPRNPITKAIQEYGRIAKTLSLLRYLHDNTHRRRIHRQLNKGEAIHALRKDIFYANRGEIRKRHEHEQDTQTLCLNLLTNAVIGWNTIYIDRIQQHLAHQGTPLPDEAIRHTSPTIRAHLNVYGRYDLHAIKTPKTGQYRPLRNP
jgi:TnpA family transposase